MTVKKRRENPGSSSAGNWCRKGLLAVEFKPRHSGALVSGSMACPGASGSTGSGLLRAGNAVKRLRQMEDEEEARAARGTAQAPELSRLLERVRH